LDLAEYLRVLRAHRVLIFVCVVVCTLAAAALAWTRTPLYETQTQFFVSTKTLNPDDIYTGGLFSQQRIQSYAQLVTSPTVLGRVIAELNLPEGGAALASRIRVSVPQDTVLINVRVTDESPQKARTIAETLGRRFAAFVSDLETERSGQTSPVKVTVSSPPQLPTSPASPNKKMYLLLGVLAGLLIGAVASVLKEVQARSRFPAPMPMRLAQRALPIPANELDFDAWPPEEPARRYAPGAASVAENVSSIVRAPLLGTVSERNGRVQLEGERVGSSRAAEYEALQANILTTARDQGFRSFIVTSAVEAEGKTAISAHLSTAFANAGYRVILVDANFENPTLTSSLGLSENIGLAEVIAEGVSIDSALHLWKTEVFSDRDLRLLTIGQPRIDPVELLQSKELDALLAALRHRADVVFVDTPPVLSSHGSQLVGAAGSGWIMVTRAQSARMDELEAATASLRSANASIVGVVVNTAGSS
jgi:tyrosine-protein kinase